MKQEDQDPLETREWLDSLESVVDRAGAERARYLLQKMLDHSRRLGTNLPWQANTSYLNTIPPGRQTPMPGDSAIEQRIRAITRWNAAMMVVRANKKNPGIGGHIATFASAATLYDVGFNHFFKAPSAEHAGDLVFVQGHSAPGIYARAFLEGRFDEATLDRFRCETNGQGLSSYPHPRLMPDFWQFPTVSMGLGPIMSIYQARFIKYLDDRKLLGSKGRKIWAFMGDGEMDEPESLGCISLAGREKLDNLIFVVNCNLQRLDGPVRGNSKIIQELESVFHGAGWNVIKIIWGSYWDPLLAKDTQGLLLKRMEEAVDGDFQNYKARDGAYTREHFFGKYPELKAMVATLTDQDIWRLNRGGHDPHKVYAAYFEAANHHGQPTVILAKTVKGYGMGESGEGANKSHQQKKMGHDALLGMRDRFGLPLTDKQIHNLEYLKLPKDSKEFRYLKERRDQLGGWVPRRQPNHVAPSLKLPALDIFAPLLAPGNKRAFSTTMAFIRILTLLCRDTQIGKHIVPIVPDEARTFGMEGLFRTLGIYSSVGQLYQPEDIDQIMFYKEDKSGQILEEAICEAGAFSSWLASATSAGTHGIETVPFYIFYSMFGFQRIGDLAWAGGDMGARGFLIGGTAGRTTLEGEGLQHQDGHSHVFSSAYPSCVSYDPCYAYELAVIIHYGLERMFQNRDEVFFYLTTANENYEHPSLPENVKEGICKGMYLLQKNTLKARPAVRLLASGPILREAIKAAGILAEDWGVGAEVWSVTSFTELRREAMEIARHNRLHPEQKARLSYLTQCLGDCDSPIIATSDYMSMYADQICPFTEAPFQALGTDGFGRSDTRKALRTFFEVNCHHIIVAALHGLAENNQGERRRVSEAIAKYDLDTDTVHPQSR